MGPTIATNGCFDILHRGHLELFRKMRQVVGEEGRVEVYINSDESFEEVKGRKPLNTMYDRMFAIDAVKWVDAGIIFMDTDPCELLRMRKPDIYCKGADYLMCELDAERDVVREYGGVTILIEYLDGYSTSALIEKLTKIAAD
ncbi:adenylyltransferase/cytidyltransferase family protein [Candidatus Pacearchaeota archaeon]|nr:adenylyltransferase/cytidyltransferase family protein [Candidatus Pacearchaeota archaeon]